MLNKKSKLNLLKANNAMCKALKITGIYLLFGSAWIIITDLLSIDLFPTGALAVNIVKGLFYVVVTSILIFFLIYSAINKDIKIHEKLQSSNDKLEFTINDLNLEKQKLLQSEQKLKESEALFRSIFDQAIIGISIGNNLFITNKDKPSVNPMFEKIVGRTCDELINLTWEDITHPDDLPTDLEYYKKFENGEIDGYEMEKRYIRPDGTDAWVNLIISHLHMENNPDYTHLCLIEDISKRKIMEETLYDAERSKAVLLDNLRGMAYRCNFDQDWTMQFVSDGCFELTGYTPESLLYSNKISFNEIIAPKYRHYLWNKWNELLKSNSTLEEEYEIITASGEIKWVMEKGQVVYDESGEVAALEGLVIDITERKKQEMMLAFISDHDSLSGLFNRKYFEEKLKRDSENINIKQRAAILINIKKFNLLNLTYGYTFAEDIVIMLAENLKKLFKDKHSIFHISIDRFILYVDNYIDTEELSEICDSIIEMLNLTFNSKTISVNIGVVEIGKIKSEAGSVIKRASIAAENSDGNQRFSYCIFDSKMEDKIIREAVIKEELEKAAFDDNNGSLYLLYQPIVDLKTNKINRFEALARFKSDRYGIVSPLEFIPIAEETQLIVPLGKIIIFKSLCFIKRLESEGFDNISVSLNVSAVQLLRDDFIPDLIEIINKTDVNPHKVIIEITESVFADNYLMINERLEKIKKIGVEISIDDFGTGYSSLSRVRELNANCLKIDKRFIDNLLCPEIRDYITGDIISMAHKLGYYVIAEGVEEEGQRNYLIDNNCDLMQGYLFSKPVSDESAIDMLNKQNRCTKFLKI